MEEGLEVFPIIYLLMLKSNIKVVLCVWIVVEKRVPMRIGFSLPLAFVPRGLEVFKSLYGG